MRRAGPNLPAEYPACAGFLGGFVVGNAEAAQQSRQLTQAAKGQDMCEPHRWLSATRAISKREGFRSGRLINQPASAVLGEAITHQHIAAPASNGGARGRTSQARQRPA